MRERMRSSVKFQSDLSERPHEHSDLSTLQSFVFALLSRTYLLSSYQIQTIFFVLECISLHRSGFSMYELMVLCRSLNESISLFDTQNGNLETRA